MRNDPVIIALDCESAREADALVWALDELLLKKRKAARVRAL